MPKGVYTRTAQMRINASKQRKGIPRKNSKWNDTLIKVFHKHMMKYPHNLKEGFRTFSVLGYGTESSIATSYYNNKSIKQYFKDNELFKIVNTVTGNNIPNRKNAVNMIGTTKGFTPYVKPNKDGTIEIVYMDSKFKKTKVTITGKDMSFSFDTID